MIHTRQLIKGITVVLTALVMILTVCACGRSSGSDYEKQLEGVCAYLEDIADDNLRAGDSGSDWTIILLSQADREYDYDEYLKELEEYVTECYKGRDKLDRVKATEWHRIAMTVLAAGGDPRNFGTDSKGRPIDLIAEGTYNWNQTDSLSTQGSNGLIYALKTLDIGDYEIPKGSLYTRESIIDDLLQYQGNDGGFALSTSAGEDTDITAMAVQALAPYRSENRRVEEAVDMALAYLSKQQQDSGLYLYDGGYSSETSSQVIMALCAVGEDPAEDENFIKTGGSLVDGLMEYRMDDGSFAHDVPKDPSETGGDNVMSSQQAGLAFVSLINSETGKE
ncbi:MAG: hypothetical protein Q4A65_04765 [Bacillota bacterium]|nr:hypothetical protein [Bacillota bacterium]